MLLVKKCKTEKEKKGIKVSFMIDEDVAIEFKKLTKQKGFFQNKSIQNAMIMLIEEMKKAEDKK